MTTETEDERRERFERMNRELDAIPDDGVEIDPRQFDRHYLAWRDSEHCYIVGYVLGLLNAAKPDCAEAVPLEWRLRIRSPWSGEYYSIALALEEKPPELIPKHYQPSPPPARTKAPEPS